MAYDSRWDNLSSSEDLEDVYSTARVVARLGDGIIANIPFTDRAEQLRRVAEEKEKSSPKSDKGKGDDADKATKKESTPPKPAEVTDEPTGTGKDEAKEEKKEQESGPAEKDEDPSDEDEEKMCRYCFDDGGKLIAPCKCKGGQKWVHEKCLRKWQRMVLCSKATHPVYHEQAPDHQAICNVCKEPFNLAPPNYDELVRGLTGEEIVSQVREGCLIVQAYNEARQSELILASNSHIPDLVRNLTPWLKGVYLIVAIGSRSEEDGEDLICAVNLSRPHKSQRWERCINTSGKHVDLQHFDSGPCDGLFGIVDLREMTREDVVGKARVMDQMEGVLLVAGSVKKIIALAEQDWQKMEAKRKAAEEDTSSQKKGDPTPNKKIRVCWGDGTWSRTQLIGEIARGGWGMCEVLASDVTQVPGKPAPPEPGDLWAKLHEEKRPLEAGDNPMMRTEMHFAAEARPIVENSNAAAEHRKRLREQLMKQQRELKKKRGNAEKKENPQDDAD